MQKAGISLTQAAAIAEDRERGRAIGASLEEVNGRVVYEVVVVSDDKPKKITLDLKDGNIK